MDLGLKDKVTIITGGGQGVGRIMAHSFAKEGAKVAIEDFKKETAEVVVKEIKAFGGEALCIQSDVSSLADMEKMTSEVLGAFGKLDILVHNAVKFSVKPFMDTPPDEWPGIIGVSQIGAFNCCRAVLPKMIEQRSGRIIFIGSDAGRVGDAYQPIYASAKGGIVSFCKSLAQDCGPKGVTVNVVSPALIMTEENKPILDTQYGLADEKRAKKLYAAYPMRRIGLPEDVANLVLFISSERAGFITGQTISVDGGYCML